MADNRLPANIDQENMGELITHQDALQVFRSVFNRHPANPTSLLLRRILSAYFEVNHPLAVFICPNMSGTQLRIAVRRFNGLDFNERNLICMRINDPNDRSVYHNQHRAYIARRRIFGYNDHLPLDQRQLVLIIGVELLRDERIPEEGRNGGRLLLSNHVQVRLPPRCYVKHLCNSYILITEGEPPVSVVNPDHANQNGNAH